ncbi:MAG: hypothetical protein AB8G18_13355 [Gammaproteobacteria bacterium]
MEISLIRLNSFFFWGVLDLIAVIGYVFYRLQLGRIPLYTDISETLTVLETYQGGDAYFLAFAKWTLAFSIPVTAFTLMTHASISKYLCLAQTPLRVLTLSCSFFLLGRITSVIDISVWTFMAIVCAVEAAKLISLWSSKSVVR